VKYSFGNGSGGGVVAISTGIPGADTQIYLLDGCNEAICRYTGNDLVGVLTLLSWGWTSDGYVNGPPKSIYDERLSGPRPPYLVAHHAGLPKRRREHT
jgi:hypothetical protein